MKKVLVPAAVLALLCLGSLTQASITIPTVPVGDVGNQADTRYALPGYGSVSYSYNIGKYEVTAGQYAPFLNAVAGTDTYGLYNPWMSALDWNGCNIQRSGSPGTYTYSVAADWANRPVNWVSYWDACRFANWLHNGQPTGLPDLSTMEDGAYYLNGYNGNDGREIQRKAGWKWAVTSEDEWYRAAYYKGGNTNAGYWDYPTSSDSTPSNVLGNPTDPGNNATYYDAGYTIGSPYYRTEVGAHENSESPYGTFDQGGNVWEWNEAIMYQGPDYAYRGLRGGEYSSYDNSLRASCRIDSYFPLPESSSVGFRVVQALPPPASVLVLGSGGILALAGMIRRRRNG